MVEGRQLCRSRNGSGDGRVTPPNWSRVADPQRRRRRRGLARWRAGSSGTSPTNPAAADRCPRRELGLICLLDQALGTLVKVLACLSRGDPARRSEQQADAETLFKLSNGLEDSGLSDAQLTRLLFVDKPFEARRLSCR